MIQEILTWIRERCNDLEILEEEEKGLGYAIGISGKANGKEWTSSAAGFDYEQVKLRALAEWIERWLLSQPSTQDRLLDPMAQLQTKPTGPLNFQGFKWSVSSGVALHSELQKAKDAACSELIERDRVLRSFFSQTPPRQILEVPWPTAILKLKKRYELTAYDFGEGVIGVFGQSNESNRPFLMGFSCGGTASTIEQYESALNKACLEMLQRYLFLREEICLNEIPVTHPSAHFHLEYYLHSKAEEELWESWIHAPSVRSRKRIKPIFWKNLGKEKELEIKGTSEATIEFKVLSEIRLDSERPLYLVQAQQQGRLPLGFGRYPEEVLLAAGLPPSDRIHPVP